MDGEEDFLTYFRNEQKQKPHINLKDISEEKFLDLLYSKNQDKRFYGWLHFHPLFDGDDSDADSYKTVKKRRQRRGSEQINQTNKENLMDFDS